MRKSSKKAAEIKRKVDKAKKEFTMDSDGFCVGCGRTDRRLSVAHVVSEKDCGTMGKDEMRCDINNFRLLCCCDSDSCHYIWDSGSVEDKQKKLVNFEEMFEYLEIHNPEKFKIWSLCLR